MEKYLEYNEISSSHSSIDSMSDNIFKEKYFKYKNKYIDLKNQVANLGEQEGGFLYPGIYIIFFIDPDKTHNISDKIIGKKNKKSFKGKDKDHDVNDFPYFKHFKNIFGLRSYSLPNNSNKICHVELQNALLKYPISISKEFIDNVTKWFNKFGLQLNYDQTKMQISKNYIDTDIIIDLKLNRNINGFINKHDFSSILTLNSEKIMSIINTINKNNRITDKNELINSIAIIDVGYVRNNLLHTHTYDKIEIPTITETEKQNSTLDLQNITISEDNLKLFTEEKNKIDVTVQQGGDFGIITGPLLAMMIVTFMMAMFCIITMACTDKNFDTPNNPKLYKLLLCKYHLGKF